MLEHFPSDLIPVLPILAIVFVASLVAAWREHRQRAYTGETDLTLPDAIHRRPMRRSAPDDGCNDSA
jgi:hypothetical protein